ncbi:ATP-binding protein [Streptomyces hokutonensis]|uniref:ATP-binding protein n=1 Tax=Streptomyces hokutonensis TaxID=1306990 RepID=UPI00035DDC76|nr:ATP-binding protein [Streptomyces hokutonensis]
MERSYVSFAPVPENGLCPVRGAVRDQLTRWGHGELAEDAVLVVSELLGNAFGHGTTPVRLSLALHEQAGHQSLLIQVSDTSPGFDTKAVRARWTRPSSTLSTGGRGLLLVEALSRSWGDRHHRRGHTVWADLPRGIA